MADNTFALKVFSGRGLEVEADARLVTAPSAVGEIGFLPNHCDFVGLLDVGIVEVEATTADIPKKFVVAGGVCTFANNTLRLLADSVDTLDSVDREKYASERPQLEARRAELSALDPEFVVIAQKLARIQSIDLLLKAEK
jgi:F-type H+-transporting ATPase subunit epsilon